MLCCAVLCCAVLCCAVLCCAVLSVIMRQFVCLFLNRSEYAAVLFPMLADALLDATTRYHVCLPIDIVNPRRRCFPPIALPL
jgi:hypothetical protein